VTAGTVTANSIKTFSVPSFLSGFTGNSALSVQDIHKKMITNIAINLLIIVQVCFILKQKTEVLGSNHIH
jgi:hypothetical protein